MICIQKIYGFHGINRQNIEKSQYVTPVTEDGGRTDGRKVENRAVFCWTRNRNIEIDIASFDENDAVYNFDLKLAKEESKDHEKCNSGKGGQ